MDGCIGCDRHRGRRGVVTAVVVALSVLGWSAAHAATGPGAAVAGCAPPAAGGEWRSYGHDLANTRTQPAENTLGPNQAATLAPAWSVPVASSAVSTSGGVAATALNGTPVVAEGCVFVGGANGDVVAVNADTGATVWRRGLAEQTPATAGLGGWVAGSVVVDQGQVIVLVNEAGSPFAVALDERDGSLIWRSPPVSTYPGAYTNANPVVYDGKLLFGFSPPEGDPNGQGGIAVLAEDDGHIITVTDTIPKADQAQGFSGGGIWSTPAVDAATGYAYIGAGNPYSKQQEHRNTNAILKLDLNAGPDFGRIVAAYKGNVDQYELSQLTHTPVCAASAGTPLDTFPLDDPACGQLDLDFGASPNLFSDALGHELVGDLQKSGYYHAAYADTMERAWSVPIGAPCALCNAASTAVADGAVLAVGTPGGFLASLAQGTGVLNWASPVADGVHYGSVTAADGVGYTVDTLGFLDAFDAATGLPLLHRPLSADSGQPIAGITSVGVAVARHTVYVEAGGSVVAYRAGTALP